MPINAAAKVTFAELPEDGQNKENDQPEMADEPVEEMNENSSATPQPPQPKDQNSDEGESKIIPWRAKLRKTNSTLNLLE